LNEGKRERKKRVKRTSEVSNRKEPHLTAFFVTVDLVQGKGGKGKKERRGGDGELQSRYTTGELSISRCLPEKKEEKEVVGPAESSKG